VTVGDIHWVQLPAADGREQRGRRPAVILQDGHYAGGLPVVLVVPVTTARATMRFAGTVLIQPTAENGLPQVSVALVFHYERPIAADTIRTPPATPGVSPLMGHDSTTAPPRPGL
jgi:mRNA-degrading endonuclease toxin of MazEF toxin-antitoxin module